MGARIGRSRSLGQWSIDCRPKTHLREEGLFGEEIRDVREAAGLLITRYPDAALQIAKALIADNHERGHEKRAKMWARVAAEIEARTLKPTPN